MKKYFFTLALVFVSIFGFSKDISQVENSAGFKTFLTQNKIVLSEIENSNKNTFEMTNFKSTIYEYRLLDKFCTILIIENQENNTINFAVVQKLSGESKL